MLNIKSIVTPVVSQSVRNTASSLDEEYSVVVKQYLSNLDEAKCAELKPITYIGPKNFVSNFDIPIRHLLHDVTLSTIVTKCEQSVKLCEYKDAIEQYKLAFLTHKKISKTLQQEMAMRGEKACGIIGIGLINALGSILSNPVYPKWSVQKEYYKSLVSQMIVYTLDEFVPRVIISEIITTIVKLQQEEVVFNQHIYNVLDVLFQICTEEVRPEIIFSECMTSICKSPILTSSVYVLSNQEETIMQIYPTMQLFTIAIRNFTKNMHKKEVMLNDVKQYTTVATLQAAIDEKWNAFVGGTTEDIIQIPGKKAEKCKLNHCHDI